MKPIHAFLLAGLLAGLLAASPLVATANELDSASVALCEKMKQCAAAEMGDAGDMSEEMKAMIMQGLDSMCIGMEENFSVAARAHELYQPAAQCMNSMAVLGCEQLMAGEDAETPECIAFRERAEAYE